MNAENVYKSVENSSCIKLNIYFSPAFSTPVSIPVGPEISVTQLLKPCLGTGFTLKWRFGSRRFLKHNKNLTYSLGYSSRGG